MKLLFIDSNKSSLSISFFDKALDYEVIVVAKVGNYSALIKAMGDINKRMEHIHEIMLEEGKSLVFFPKPWSTVSKKFGTFTKTKEGAWWSSLILRNGENVYQFITCELEKDSISIRQQQFKELANIREKSVPSLITCDSQILYFQEERFSCPEGFQDAWKEMGTMDNQFTREKSRQDRVWFSGVKCISYDIIDFRRNVAGIGVEFIEIV